MANGDGFDVPAGAIVMETQVDFDGLDRGLREFDKKGEEAGQRVGEKFGSGFGQAVDEGGARPALDEVGEGMEETGEKAEEAGEKVESTDEKVDEMGETMETAGKAGAGLAITLSKRLGGAVSRVGAGVVGLVESSLDLLSGSLTNLGEQLQDQSDEFGRFALAAEGAGRVLESVGRIAGAVASAMTGARFAMVAGAGALAIASKRAADDFVPSWNRVLTLIPEGTEGLTELRREVDDLGASLGLTAEVTNDTFYQVLSAMPQLAKEPQEALEVLRVALEAGATGFTEASTAAKAITGTLNAFQMEAEEARRVSDALFAAQDQGVLTFGQIASEINKVSGITNALEGDFEDLLAIVSTTTGELSQSVPETFTQVRGLIRAIVSPTAQAQEAWMALEGSSEELSAAMIREEGLIGALERVVEVTEGSPDAISRIIPRASAQTLVISLADRMDRLRDRLEAVGDASGTTEEKVDQMMDSWESQEEVFGRQIDQMLRLIAESAAFGQSIEDASTMGLAGLNTVLGTFNDILSVLNKIDDAIDSVTEDIIFDAIAGTFGLISEGSKETVAGLRRTLRMMQRVEQQAQETNERVREAQGEVRLSLPPRGGTTEPGHPLTPRLPPREPDPIERPDAPTGPEFIRSRIEARRARMEVEAFQELIQTGDVEAYREELEDIQGVVNDLVQIEVERLRQMDIEAERLQELIDLYEEQQSEAGKLLQTAGDLQEAVKEQPEPPPLPEGVSRMEIGGVEERVRRAQRELEPLLKSTETNAEDVFEVLNKWGVSLQDIRDHGIATFSALTGEILSLDEEARNAKENQEEFVEEFEKMAAVTDGVANAAEAMGDLDDRTRAALNAVSSLMQAGVQFARGNFFAGGAQAAGALANIIGSAVGGKSERERVVEENTLALRALREDLEKLQSIIASTPGDVLAALEPLEEAVEQFPDFRDARGPFFGREDSDVFGAPEATGAEVERFLDEMGLSVTEFLQQAQRFGVTTENITKALEEGEAPMSAVRQEFEDFTEALREIEFENFFEGFEGAMREFEARLEIFDEEFDSPIDKLEAYREAFLEHTELPEKYRKALEEADLTTSAGRQTFEEIIKKIFKLMASGELGEEALGELTPEEFLEALERMEGFVDEASGGGPTETGFQTVNQISRVQASQFIALLGTNVHWNRRTALAMEKLVGDGAIPAPPAPGASEGATFNFGPFDFDISLPEGAGAGEIEEGVRRGIRQGVDEALGSASRDRDRDAGRAPVRMF